MFDKRKEDIGREVITVNKIKALRHRTDINIVTVTTINYYLQYASCINPCFNNV